jgi:predicted O-methyltransferase YrrM
LTQEGFVFCVDWFHGGPTTPESNWTMPEFVNNMDAAGLLKKTVILPMVSTEALPLLRRLGLQFGTVFLDADHRELAVERDLDMVWPLLGSGGLLVVDDYEPAGNHPGVIVAADKFMLKRGLAIERCVGKDISIRKP